MLQSKLYKYFQVSKGQCDSLSALDAPPNTSLSANILIRRMSKAFKFAAIYEISLRWPSGNLTNNQP